ncbi:unnamed protein product [Pedinophyceae sp. YPF-701]|nr:unnamed protein product [Pedinophyceae sp. YPF-701]
MDAEVAPPPTNVQVMRTLQSHSGTNEASVDTPKKRREGVAPHVDDSPIKGVASPEVNSLARADDSGARAHQDGAAADATQAADVDEPAQRDGAAPAGPGEPVPDPPATVEPRTEEHTDQEPAPAPETDADATEPDAEPENPAAPRDQRDAGTDRPPSPPPPPAPATDAGASSAPPTQPAPAPPPVDLPDSPASPHAPPANPARTATSPSANGSRSSHASRGEGLVFPVLDTARQPIDAGEQLGRFMHSREPSFDLYTSPDGARSAAAGPPPAADLQAAGSGGGAQERLRIRAPPPERSVVSESSVSLGRRTPPDYDPEAVVGTGGLEPPTPEEVTAHAEYLGMTPGADAPLLWIAEQSLCAPVPAGWEVLEDHTGNAYFFDTIERRAQWEHPLEGDYRALFALMATALRGGATCSYPEVTSVARHMGVDSASEPLLMWIVEQAALAPLPEGWVEEDDGKGGAFFRDTLTGHEQRAHPLDSVFRMLLFVERDRLAKNVYSIVCAGGSGSPDGSSACMRLHEDTTDGRVFYIYDWVTRQKVKEERPEPPPPEPDPGSEIIAIAPELAKDGSGAVSPAGGSGPVDPMSPGVSPVGGRVPLTLRATRAAAKPSPGGRAAALGGTVGGVKRGGWGVRKGEEKPEAALARARAAVDDVRPEGWNKLNPLALTVFAAYALWSFALAIPLLRRVVSKPRPTGQR